MLYLLCGMTAAFLAAAMYLSENDWTHPSVVFSAVFFVCSLFCVVEKNKFAITLEPVTAAVILAGILVFLILELAEKKLYLNRKGKSKNIRGRDDALCSVSDIYVVLLILAQTVSIFFFVKYLGMLSAAYGEVSGQTFDSLGEKIKLFDTMTKFWPDTYASLNLKMPMAYRITNPLCMSAEFLVFYVGVKDFYYHKKINWLYIVVLFLAAIRVLMNGSRSPLLRIITFVGILYLIFQTQDKKKIKFGWKLLLGLAAAGTLLAIGMLILLFAMGRGEDFDLETYLFTYVGAQIENLDTFLKANPVTLWRGVSENKLFGADVFRGLYLYLKKWIHLEVSIPSIAVYAFSNNGIEIGNVYTMFYALLYDFGYVGCVVFTAVMAGYYVFTYGAIIRETPQKNRIIDLKTFLYAYLFNDLLMSFFSNRFYETVFDGTFFKFVLLTICLDVLIEYDPVKRLCKNKKL